MEAGAFVSKDVDHLLDIGLSFIPSDSQIAVMIAQIRSWVKIDADWQRTRQRIEDNYGYDKYSGVCHVMPNHGIMIMTLLYAGDNFSHALHIVNTCGWDTDCNSGNVGCLVAIMHGMADFESGPDWRVPVADRAFISSADGGYSVNDAAQISYDVVEAGCRLAGEVTIPRPKAQFHFTLPGSVQGFSVASAAFSEVRQGIRDGRPGIYARIDGCIDTSVDISTPVFTPVDVTVGRHYQLVACPLLYPGQHLRAQVSIDEFNAERMPSASVCLRIKACDEHDQLAIFDSTPVELKEALELEWTVPKDIENKPIQQVGIAIDSDEYLEGRVWLHALQWEGIPTMRMRRPSVESDELQGVEFATHASFWERSWVSTVDKFHTSMGPSFYLAHDRGEGMVMQGTRDWTDYEAVADDFTVNLGAPAGLAIRVRGLNRWYAVMFVKGKSSDDGHLVLIKAKDEQRVKLASKPFCWKLDTKYEVRIRASGNSFTACVAGVVLEATDGEHQGGGVGLIVTDGSLVSEDPVDSTAMVDTLLPNSVVRSCRNVPHLR